MYRFLFPSFAKLWGTSNFNKAQKAFLSCLQALIAHGRQLDPSLHVPFEVAPEGTVGGLPLQYASRQEEQWSTALACVAMDLKWLMQLVMRPQFAVPPP